MPGFFDPTTDTDSDQLAPERRDALIDKIARAVVDRNLTAPAIFFLESVKPLSFVGSQVMVFFDPLVRSIFNVRNYNDIRLALEDRENVELLLRAIEGFDAQARDRRRAARAKAKSE